MTAPRFDSLHYAFNAALPKVIESLDEWAAQDPHSFVVAAVNDEINRFVAEYVGGGLAATAPALIPYHGWYWRSVDFIGGRITVAHGEGITGICENNKWGHPQRQLTEIEAAEFLRLIWKAYRSGKVDKLRTARLRRAGEFISILPTDGMVE